ncbi:glycosyltransferase family 4 protein [Pseudarthrobacter sp. J64]|uniref:glycosyltransferase family 4 protein n=1 Tax=Pseudarthrobacter sp. J64 TaxID=3116485 RepID=UPI002E8001F4|nr:glycosyltransferase family 4 protein [Pseudarthrobacter sp. J64]MEE2570448.1 glycosyltransferase family 4 protein [Pseudarthrobacter sp. J64]
MVTVDGGWPGPSARERRKVAGLLGAWSQGSGDAAGVTIVDGLIASACPDEMEYAALARQAPWVLLHMPFRDEPAKERRALAAAAGIICPSVTGAREIQALHGLTSVVAVPGTEPAPVAEGSTPPHLAMVAALHPNKAQLLAVRALALVADQPWTASLVGSGGMDPDYAAAVETEINRLGLGGRVRMTDELTGSALAAEWHRSNLTLLVSRSETFGLAVTESLARAIPVVVRAGTGAEEALTLGTPDGGIAPGAAVELVHGPGEEDPEPLADALRTWLDEPEVRERWRSAALKSRGRLPGWDATALAVLAAVTRGVAPAAACAAGGG